MPIKFCKGNIFDTKCKTLVNTVNCVGVMGKGIAMEFKKKYPQMFEDYRNKCKRNMVIPGVPYHYSDVFGTSIINFPTKYHWRDGSRIEWVERGLDVFVENYRNWNIKSVAFPALGCGNGGLDWNEVRKIMVEKLDVLDIIVEIYEPSLHF